MHGHLVQDLAPSTRVETSRNCKLYFQKNTMDPLASTETSFGQAANDSFPELLPQDGCSLNLIPLLPGLQPCADLPQVRARTIEVIWAQRIEGNRFAMCYYSTFLFRAKEANVSQNLYPKFKYQSLTIPDRAANSNPGDSEIIWNSSSSNPSRKHVFPQDISHLRWDSDIGHNGLLKARKQEWGNLRLLCFHARIGKLLDRDYVWVVTQTMVSFENLALWAKHSVLTYKVYPGYWGRPNFVLCVAR